MSLWCVCVGILWLYGGIEKLSHNRCAMKTEGITL